MTSNYAAALRFGCVLIKCRLSGLQLLAALYLFLQLIFIMEGIVTEIYNIKVGEIAYFENNGIKKAKIREIWHFEKHIGKGIDGENKEYRERVEVMFEDFHNCAFPFERVGVSLQELKGKLFKWEGISENTLPSLATIEGCKALEIQKLFNDFQNGK